MQTEMQIGCKKYINLQRELQKKQNCRQKYKQK